MPTTVEKWVVIDTNVVLHQVSHLPARSVPHSLIITISKIDLISSADFPLPLLVPQTVLDEVRHRSLPLYNRLKTLIDEDFADSSKRGFIVWNEAMEETYLVRDKGETINDRNDRGELRRSLCLDRVLTILAQRFDISRRTTQRYWPRTPAENDRLFRLSCSSPTTRTINEKRKQMDCQRSPSRNSWRCRLPTSRVDSWISSQLLVPVKRRSEEQHCSRK